MRASEPIAIRVENLSKQYVIGHNRKRRETFREALMTTLSKPFHYLADRRAPAVEEEEFWALRDVSFEIRKGEIVGLIGRNGAGKSTLLKILSRITEPTRGRVEIRGRVASLLEVGTGFHGELSGRENIYLNGAILGMTRSQIHRKFDEIVSFAEVEKFIDTPVKRYSSGMYVRLAFAVAAHLEPDILLVDEVLAVGDARFQNKCLGKLEDVAGLGRTVLFVSHNLGAVQRLCSRAILLDHKVMHIGTVDAAISKYLADRSSLTEAASLIGPLRELVAIKSVSVNEQEFAQAIEIRPRCEIQIRAVLNIKETIKGAKVVIWVTKDGKKITGLHDTPQPRDMSPGQNEVRVSLPPFFLSPGQYEASLFCFSNETKQSAWSSGLCSFLILPEADDDYDIWNMGLINLKGRGSRSVLMD